MTDPLVQELRALVASAVSFVPGLIAALVVFGVTLLLARLASGGVRRAIGRYTDNGGASKLLEGFVRWTIVVIGVIVALDQVNFNVTSFVAGLGIVSVILGFAFQDIAKNLMAGIILILQRPFQVGDSVKLFDHGGTVLALDLRDTTVKTWDGEQVILPNADVLGNPITNYSVQPLTRRKLTLGLDYGQDVERAVQAFLDTLRRVPGVSDQPAPSIYVKNGSERMVDMELYFWVNRQTHDLFSVHSAAVMALVARTLSEGIQVSQPTQTVQLERQQPSPVLNHAGRSGD